MPNTVDQMYGSQAAALEARKYASDAYTGLVSGRVPLKDIQYRMSQTTDPQARAVYADLIQKVQTAQADPKQAAAIATYDKMQHHSLGDTISEIPGVLAKGLPIIAGTLATAGALAPAAAGAIGAAGAAAGKLSPGGVQPVNGPTPSGIAPLSSGFLGTGMTPAQAAMLGLAGAGIVSGSQQMGQANTLVQNALKQPQGLVSRANAPDLSSIYRPAFNPYSDPSAAPGGSGAVDAAAAALNGGRAPVLPGGGPLPAGVRPMILPPQRPLQAAA